MAHPVIWSPKLHFYPIGNTPATTLANYIPPDEDAAILVLGCGDPRNAFYTIASDSKFSFNRALDFTFCDNEPAVLARNIIIYTLLYDQCDESAIKNVWKIYFDVFIDEKSFQLLSAHCQTLVDLSGSLEKWNSHPYGTFIKFCTVDTLLTLRRYWESYILKGKSPTGLKPNVVKEMKEINAHNIEGGVVTTSLRSAGIMCTKLVSLGPDHFNHYWKHGVADVKPSEINSASHVNPTMLYSPGGDNLHLHYGTDPILCFHLAPAIASMENKSKTPVNDMVGLLDVIHSQFTEWCRSFHERMNATISKGKVTLRFFSGNAMSLCKALHSLSQTGSLDSAEYTNFYGASTISFVEEYQPTSTDRPPLTFNVIDTSNLSDHIGLLNILLISAPILKRDSFSVLFTHSLVSSRDKKGTHSSALLKTGVDPPLLSLLFGMVPERVVSEVTSQSIAHELILGTTNSGGNIQLFEFNCWRVPTPEIPGMAYTFSSDSAQLAESLFSVYMKLFADETFGGPQEIKHYTRDTYVSLLSFAKNAYAGSWEPVMTRVMDLISNERSIIVGMNYYQELCRGLQLAGLLDIVPNPEMFPKAKQDYCFQGWADIPITICVVLVIPRKNIQNLLDDSKQLKTPPLQCEIKMPAGHNAFTAFQPTFGTIEEISPSPNKKVVIHEDPIGWAGKSDLIVHFLAPAWLFVQRPLREYEIGVNMYGTSAMLSFGSKLGMFLSIYSTTLANAKHAFILRDRPRIASETVAQDVVPLSTSPVSPTLTGISSHQEVSVEFENHNTSAFTIRRPVTDKAAKATLANQSTKVETKALSRTAVQVSFEGFRSIINFPYPVETSALKTRIARKSSYIEVEGRVTHKAKVPVDLDPFPIVRASNVPCALRMHYLSLDSLPAFRSPIPPADDLGWLDPHFALSIGEEKRKFKKLGQKQPGLLELKESICLTFKRFFEDFKGEPCVFHLADSDKGTYTMLFISCVRLDLTAHTIVADACVLPMTLDLVGRPSVKTALSSLHGRFPMATTATPPEEIKWWKTYLPTAVERCRTWSHGQNCEYIAEGIPRSLNMAEDPICSCGRGKDLGKFLGVKEWTGFRPHVTRAAIGIPFSTSLFPELASELRTAVSDAKKAGTGGGGGGGGGSGCAKCGQPGKPKLLLCSKCRGVQYCSAVCQKADWKEHKKGCGK